MITIYLPPELIAQQHGISLSAEKARYITTVLRSRAGDSLRIIDGQGTAYSATIIAARKGSVVIDITGPAYAAPEAPVRTILAIGMLKGEKMELVIQKATELGVSEIIPLITEYSQLRTTRKTARWGKIAEEAAEQCGRAVIPLVDEPRDFGAFLEKFRTGGSAGVFFYEGGGKRLDVALPVIGRTDSLCLCIGPEGGFSIAEADAASVAGFERATLGDMILRAETASIVAIALVHFCLGRR